MHGHKNMSKLSQSITEIQLRTPTHMHPHCMASLDNFIGEEEIDNKGHYPIPAHRVGRPGRTKRHNQKIAA